ncbi:hypothetical protein I656_02282 [Geobacillus sp. WSUCF1]|nr:hypothetical protein I656_02282 [Geobacillus sp. WSUCF1]GAJ59611.1 hypothetical protein B23_2836 [Geobacillus thermoleovorans B23]
MWVIMEQKARLISEESGSEMHLNQQTMAGNVV